MARKRFYFEPLLAPSRLARFQPAGRFQQPVHKLSLIAHVASKLHVAL